MTVPEITLNVLKGRKTEIKKKYTTNICRKDNERIKPGLDECVA